MRYRNSRVIRGTPCNVTVSGNDGKRFISIQTDREIEKPIHPIWSKYSCQLVPKHDAFNRAFNRLSPATLLAIKQAVVETAVQLGLEDGKRLRVDTTSRD